MATIDTSIYQNQPTVRLQTPFELEAGMQAIQQGKNQNRLAGMQFKEAERKDTERNMLADAYRQSYNPDGTQDRNKLYGTLAKGGQGQLVPGLQEQYNKADASGIELRSKQFKLSEDKRIQSAQRLGALRGKPYQVVVQDLESGLREAVDSGELSPEQAQQIYAQMIQRIPQDQAGLDAFIDQSVRSVMTPQQQMTQGNSDRSYGMDVAKFDYQKDHDAATLAQQRENSIRVDTRARDLNAAKVEENRIKRLEKQAKPMPAAALRMQQEELDAIATASSINADIGTVEQQIKGGKLNLGPIDNALAKGRNMAGLSNESSRNYATFQATLEKLRNDSLRLNKGVQTDGDSQRAWNELLKNINDPKVVAQRLGEIKKINKRAATIREFNVENIRNNYGAGPLDTSSYSKQPTALGGETLPGGWTVKEK